MRVRPRLAGICGSDLATIDGTSSRYFEPIVSFPFTPGHEVVGELDDGTRAVLVPVLTLRDARHRAPCATCAAGRINLASASPSATWSPGCSAASARHRRRVVRRAMVAHRSQLVAVPDDLSDEAAVMVEPAACAVHAAPRCDGGDRSP